MAHRLWWLIARPNSGRLVETTAENERGLPRFPVPPNDTDFLRVHLERQGFCCVRGCSFTMQPLRPVRKWAGLDCEAARAVMPDVHSSSEVTRSVGSLRFLRTKKSLVGIKVKSVGGYRVARKI